MLLIPKKGVVFGDDFTNSHTDGFPLKAGKRWDMKWETEGWGEANLESFGAPQSKTNKKKARVTDTTRANNHAWPKLWVY